MKWQIAQNEWNVKDPPWREAVAIEDVTDEGLAVPPIVCYLTRGRGQDRAAPMIAAAPEMYETLQLCAGALRKGGHCGEHDDCWPCDAYHQAIAALGKARPR